MSTVDAIAKLRIAVGAVPASDTKAAIAKKAAEIANAMARIHGGDWRPTVDHERGFVVVARLPGPTPN